MDLKRWAVCQYRNHFQGNSELETKKVNKLRERKRPKINIKRGYSVVMDNGHRNRNCDESYIYHYMLI